MRCLLVLIGLSTLPIVAIACDSSVNPTKVLGGVTGNLTPERNSEVEPNDTFGQATSTPIDPSVVLDLVGTMASATDIDIYDLGPIPAGDRVSVFVEHAPGMDLAAALFDEQERLIVCNDDRYWRADLRPTFAVTLRWDCRHCYLVLASSPTTSTTAGAYTATVIREQDSVPASRPQFLYLNFNGAKAITIPTRKPVDIPVFDAARIDPSFAGRSAEMSAAVVEAVRTHFARFDVTIVSSTESQNVPPDASVIHFGTYDPDLLGLADSVDEYNLDLTQKAIIFTDTFSLFMPLKPTLAQIAVAIANVASHESGHLLGLEHTQQWTDLMDTTAPAQAMLSMQSFEAAPLYKEVFAIGRQDSPLLLARTVGTRSIAAASRIDRVADSANTGTVAWDGLSAINDGAPPSFQHAGPAAQAFLTNWRLLLYGHGSVRNEISKDCFAVHSRRRTAG